MYLFVQARVFDGENGAYDAIMGGKVSYLANKKINELKIINR